MNGHILIRAPSGGVSFQHQQFQEWYASLDVGQIMRQAAQGDAEARTRLRTEILNWPAWEESILFACERLSRENAAGAQAVAAAIRDTLAIDPMLAAEMIFRSAPEVWTSIGDEVTAFAERWHVGGKVDRAARFMMTTGRPEFAPQIWPLISSQDNQIYLEALRSPRRFRPAVLGDNAAQKLAALPEETRKHVVAEIAGHSGFDGMELAVRVAKAEPSADAVLEVLQALQFRHANRMVSEILKTASDEVWRLVARAGYPDELADPDQKARLAGLRQAHVAAETDPAKLLSNLAAHRPGDAGAEARIADVIASADYPVRNDHAAMSLQPVFQSHPAPVREGLLRRVAARLELPYRAHEYLSDAAVLDDGPIVEAALDPATPGSAARAAFAVIGPKTVGTLIDRLSTLREVYLGDRNAWGRPERQAERNEYGWVQNAIISSRKDSFLAALLERSDTDDPVHIDFLAEVFARHGRDDDEQRADIAAETRAAMVRTIQRWIDAMLQSPRANRHQFAAVARAAARLPDPQFVSGLRRMLGRDLADWARTREEHGKAPYRGPASPDVTHSYVLDYQRAFAAIGDDTAVEALKGYLPDLRFGINAAGALLEIWNREHPSGKAPHLAFGHDYSRAKELRKQRRDAPRNLATRDFAEAIFDVARSIGTNEADPAAQRHALALSVVGLGIPHGSKRAEIDALLALPLPYATKQRLLMAAAMAGEIVPADTLIAGINDLLETGKKESWRLAEDRGELMSWVELFAFSDRPEAVLEVLDLLPRQYGYPSSLDRLLSALGKSPHDGALGVLQALGHRDPKITARYDWLDAMITLGTKRSSHALIEMICDGQLAGARGVDSFHLSRQLARLGEAFPSIKDDMLQWYERIKACPGKSILESALVELADPSIILALIRGCAADKRPYDGGLSHALRRAALGQRPVEGWIAGAYEEFSVSLAELRRELFAMVLANNAQSALAERCLVAIDKLRDAYGRIDDEPRHPDIASGRPWPLVR